MNKQRRKELGELSDRIEKAFATVLGDLQSEAEGCRDEAERLKDEEQEALDALPESLQDGDRGQAMSDAVSKLGDVQEALDELASAFMLDVADLLSKIDDARGQA